MKAISQAAHFPFPVFPPLPLPPFHPRPPPLLRQRWRRSSLISPEPTGLFFHLRIPPSRRRGRSAFHIFCLFKSLAAFQSVHFLPSCRRAVSLSWHRLFMLSSPLQLKEEIFQSATLSRPLLPPPSPLVSLVLVYSFWTHWRHPGACLAVCQSEIQVSSSQSRRSHYGAALVQVVQPRM